MDVERSPSIHFNVEDVEEVSQSVSEPPALLPAKTFLKPPGGQVKRFGVSSFRTRVKSISLSSATTFLSDCEEDRRSVIYERSVTLQEQHQEGLEKKFEEREAYREERRLVVNGKKEETARSRAQQWLATYFTIAPCWAFEQLIKITRSYHLLRSFVLPVWHRRLKLAARRRLQAQQTKELRSCLKKPSFHIFLNRPFFEMWPRAALHRMAATLHPVQYNTGEYMMFDGDPGDQMYFIISGSVEIIVHKKGPCKSRARENGSVVATLGEGAHFGEFAMLNDEPRMASVQCNEPTICWALNKKTFQEELQKIPPNDPMREWMTKSILMRRRDNMGKLYPLTVKQLTQIPIFTGWSKEALEPIISAVEPCVIPATNVIFTEGSNANCVYFVACGQVQLWRKTAWWQQLASTKAMAGPARKIDGKMWDAELGELVATLRRGDAFGEMGVVMMEPHPYTAKAVTITDLWQLPRQKFREILLSDAASFLRAKALLCKKHAELMDPVPLDNLGKCTTLCQLLGADISNRTLEAVQSLLVPQVVSMGETVTIDCLLFVTHGVVESHLHCTQVSAGMYIGGERLLNPQSPVDTIRAVTVAEVWILPVDQVSQLKRLSKSPGAASAVRGRVKFAQASLFMDYRLQRTLIVISACVRLQWLGRRARSHPTTRFRHNVNHLDTLQAGYDTNGLSPVSSDDSYLSPAMMQLRPSGSPVKLRNLLTPQMINSFSSNMKQEGDSLTKSPLSTSDVKKEKPFAAKRAAHAIKFASGFMPPGFTNRITTSPVTLKLTKSPRDVQSPSSTSPKSTSPQSTPSRTTSLHNPVVIGRPKFDRQSSCSPTSSPANQNAYQGAAVLTIRKSGTLDHRQVRS